MTKRYLIVEYDGPENDRDFDLFTWLENELCNMKEVARLSEFRDIPSAYSYLMYAALKSEMKP